MTKPMTPEERRLMSLEAALDDVVYRAGQLKLKIEILERDKETLKDNTKLELEGLHQNQAAFDETIKVLAGQLELLVKQIEQERKPVFCWLTTLDEQEMDLAQERVTRFASDIVALYPNGILEDCWRRHPVVVEQLLTLEDLFTQSYSADFRARPGQRVEFWQRWLKEGVKQIREELNGCSLAHPVHHDAGAYVVPQQAGLDGFEDFRESWRVFHGKAMPVPPPAGTVTESRQRAEAGRITAERQWDRD